MSVELTLYTRSGCHLCEDMEQALSELKTEPGFSMHIISIDNNADLEQSYGTRVPVLMIGSEVICEYFLDEVALKRTISAHVDAKHS